MQKEKKYVMAYDTWENFINAKNMDIGERVTYSFSDEKDIVPGRRTDADRTRLAFEIYRLLLEAQGCKEVQGLFDGSRSREDSERLIKERLKDTINRKKLGRYPRPGFLFLYKGRWCALEVDTLIGPNTYQDITGEAGSYLHTIGNLGLVPFGSGSFTTYRFAGDPEKSKSDYLRHKIEHSFENGFTRGCGFASSEELYEVMLYDVGGNGLCRIDRNSTKNEIDQCILNRGKAVLNKILTFLFAAAL